MATKKKSPVKKKTPAKKAAAVKKAVKKTVKKAAPKKAAPKKKASKPAGPREQKLASSALKLVDQAAAALRHGIRTGANTTEQSRLAAKKRAHSLLSQAASSLGGILDSGSSALHSAISKI